MQHVIKGVLAAFLLAGASGAAGAVPAIVETDLNVRSGPSTGYPVVDTMPAGATVDVVACYSGWCEIVWDGLDGFASRSYLAIAPGVTVIEPPAGAIVAPGIVVYETRYFERPIWTSRGHIIRQAIRRDIRRDLRRDRREDRREVRQERREDRRELRRDREERREVRQERREQRAAPARNVRREIRRTREDRAQAVRERPRRIENSRRNVERRSLTNSRARVQEQRQQRREVRQQRRNEAAQARPQRERRETTGRGSR